MSFAKITVGGITFEAHRAGDGAGRIVIRDDTAERLGDNVPIAILIPSSARILVDWLTAVLPAVSGKDVSTEVEDIRRDWNRRTEGS